jgi:hypothetical protein
MPGVGEQREALGEESDARFDDHEAHGERDRSEQSPACRWIGGASSLAMATEGSMVVLMVSVTVVMPVTTVGRGFRGLSDR